MADEDVRVEVLGLVAEDIAKAWRPMPPTLCGVYGVSTRSPMRDPRIGVGWTVARAEMLGRWTFIREAMWIPIRACRGGVSASPLAFWASSRIVRDPRDLPGGIPRDPPLDIAVTSVQFQIRIPIEISITIKNRPKSFKVIKNH